MDDIDHAQDQAMRQAEAILADVRARNAAAASSPDRPALRTCVDCPDPIEARRLVANPAAIRCTACQADAEAQSSSRLRPRGVAA